jgi:hypothetical protein
VFFIQNLTSELPIGGSLREGQSETRVVLRWLIQREDLSEGISLTKAHHFRAHLFSGNYFPVTQAIRKFKPIAFKIVQKNRQILVAPRTF